jgi:Kef-type K+ transport system membrane component KefB
MPANLHLVFASAVELSTPKGAPWEFLIVFATLLLGPALLERARVPGIIGLLLGGYVIGPHGLGLINSGNTTIPDLGQLGLLYLMFVAGVELDLNLLRRHRRPTIFFGLITFALPMTFGVSAGLALGWETQAAILLGSLLASHTLIAYPAVREAGLASDPAVATAVGSTVLTDTLTLVVLAAVAGVASGQRSSVDVAIQLVVGLAALIAFSLIALPILARWAFGHLGTGAPVRYVVAVTAFLSAATVAELFGIESIVGAFFAGLALNRLVPNEGQLMDRIAFFGGAVFIPVFLISVGLILDPSVMFKPDTLELAAIFCVACFGGKALAAVITARVLRFSRAQAGLLFSLSAAQAAATLAATVVGFQLGLFSSAVVNAVLVVIFLSMITSTLVGKRSAEQLKAEHRRRPPELVSDPLGTRVVVAMREPDRAGAALAIGVRVARADCGVVQPVLVVPESDGVSKTAQQQLVIAAARAGVEGLPTTVVDRSFLHGALHAGAAADATLVLIAEPSDQDDSLIAASELLASRSDPVPMLSVRGDAPRIGTVRAVGGANAGVRPPVAHELARRLGGESVAIMSEEANWQDQSPGDVTFLCGDVNGGAPGSDAAGVIVTTLLDIPSDPAATNRRL